MPPDRVGRPTPRRNRDDALAQASCHLRIDTWPWLNDFSRAYQRRVDGARACNESVRQHLLTDLCYQDGMVRFIENHDEPWAATAFPDEKSRAAALPLCGLSRDCGGPTDQTADQRLPANLVTAHAAARTARWPEERPRSTPPPHKRTGQPWPGRRCRGVPQHARELTSISEPPFYPRGRAQGWRQRLAARTAR